MPSQMVILLSIFIKMAATVMAIKKGIPKVSTSVEIVRFWNKPKTPITTKMLNMFEPKMLPKATSNWPLRVALVETIISGNDVPIAAMLKVNVDVLKLSNSANFKRD